MTDLERVVYASVIMGMPYLDFETYRTYTGGREPDVVISSGGKPYLYRWYVVPHSTAANIYFHLQVASDPDRPLHDHPWDSQSVILAGGYDEVRFNIHTDREFVVSARKGDVIHRSAADRHRLILPEGTPFTMTQFSTGPKVRDWGFYTDLGWERWDVYLANKENHHV